MTEDEIALHAAVNVLRDSIESGRMPSGEPLQPDASRCTNARRNIWRLSCDRLPSGSCRSGERRQ
jgi:hypothetical protein